MRISYWSSDVCSSDLMHQTKKGNQWYFGMKAHIGVDTDSGLVHTVTTTPANVGDVTQTGALLHGDEEVVYADAGYTGAQNRPELAGVKVDWRIAERRSAEIGRAHV